MVANSEPLQTVIVGSLPKPGWLASANGLFAPWRVLEQFLGEAQDDAVRLALDGQHEAGLDIVTDGEQRRRHYIWGFLEGLSGIDMERLGQKRARGGRYSDSTSVARIEGAVEWSKPVLADGIEFTRRHTDRPLKVTLPGPMTIVDSTLDEHYGWNEAQLAMHFADIVNREARALADAGVDIIQFDEPTFNIYVDEVKDWGMEALERAADGITVKTAVHICYGYGVPGVLQWKNQNTEWSHYEATLPLLAASSIDMVSVELAASGVDPAVLAGAAGMDVMAGVIDVGTEEAESPETVAERIERLLPYVPADRLYPSTDCGMVPRSREASQAKMHALVAGAELARSRIDAGVAR
jgi:5-methyltetrahydropteroyltriglutamate--homocysteine methyltransferase